MALKNFQIGTWDITYDVNNDVKNKMNKHQAEKNWKVKQKKKQNCSFTRH